MSGGARGWGGSGTLRGDVSVAELHDLSGSETRWEGGHLLGRLNGPPQVRLKTTRLHVSRGRRGASTRGDHHWFALDTLLPRLLEVVGPAEVRSLELVLAGEAGNDGGKGGGQVESMLQGCIQDGVNTLTFLIKGEEG